MSQTLWSQVFPTGCAHKINYRSPTHHLWCRAQFQGHLSNPPMASHPTPVTLYSFSRVPNPTSMDSITSLECPNQPLCYLILPPGISFIHYGAQYRLQGFYANFYSDLSLLCSPILQGVPPYLFGFIFLLQSVASNPYAWYPIPPL